jgi:site-specific DNA recombinase
MQIADLYIRVSTDEQADKGYSQRYQEEVLRRYCEFHKISIRQVYIEDHSAKTFKRPEFQKLLINIRKHKAGANLLLFTKWDRFSRNTSDAYMMLNTLDKLGIEAQAVEQPLDLSVPENKMMLAIYLAQPEVENDRRSLNVFGGMRKAKKEGRWMGTAPIGYKNRSTEGGKKYIAPDPAAAAIMQWVFLELSTGKFTTESVFKKAKEKGLVCSKNNFWTAIRNPVYCGQIRVEAYKNEPEQLVGGQHEPLITEALFYQVQDVLDGRKKLQRRKIEVDDRFPLRGFLLCPECGRLLTASSSKGRKDYYHYYHCVSSCGVRFKSGVAEDKLKKELSRWNAHSAVVALYKAYMLDIYHQFDKIRNSEIRRIKNEMDRVATRLRKNRDFLFDDIIDQDDYRIEKKFCEQAMIKLEAEMADLAPAENIEPLVEDSAAALSSLDTEYEERDTAGRRELIDSIYPEKLTFDGVGYRTARINEAVQLIYSIGAAFGEIKMGQTNSNFDLSHQVNPVVRFSNHFLYDLRRLAKLHRKAA